MTQQSEETEKTRIERDTCTPMFIAALFILAWTWKQPRCQSADKWIRNLWYIYTMKYSVQFSHLIVSDSLRPHELQHARPPCLSPTLEFPQTHVHRVSDAIQPSHPLSSPSPPAPNPSQQQSLFQWVNSSCEVAIVLEFQLRIIPSKEHAGLTSFRMDWLDLLAVQGILKSLLQHHSSKASILQHSAFFTVQLSHPYMTTGKTMALTRWTFVGKVMSLLFNMLSRFVITFLTGVSVF